MKRLLALLLALTVTVGLSATALADWTTEDVTLSIIHEHTAEAAVTVASSRNFLKVQDEFAAEHPNVKLDVTALGSSEIFNKLTILAAANDLPDIVYLNTKVYGAIKDDNMLVDLTGYVDPANYRDGLKTFSNNGQINGVPTKYTTYDYVFYNAQLWKDAGYDEFPTTWEEMLKANEYFASKGITTLIMGNKLGFFITNGYLDAIMYEICGEEWINHLAAGDGQANWTDDCFIQCLNELQTLIPLFNKDFVTADDQWAVAEYCKGTAAATVSGSWVPGSIKSYEDDYPGITAGTRVAALPTMSGDPAVVNYAAPQGLGINANLTGSKLDAAIAFVQYMGSDKYSQYQAADGELGPVQVDVDPTNLVQMQVDLFDVMNSHENKPIVGGLISSAESTALSASLNSFMAGVITADECAAEVQAAATR